jgi:hypothetical protein
MCVDATDRERSLQCFLFTDDTDDTKVVFHLTPFVVLPDTVRAGDVVEMAIVTFTEQRRDTRLHMNVMSEFVGVRGEGKRPNTTSAVMDNTMAMWHRYTSACTCASQIKLCGTLCEHQPGCALLVRAIAKAASHRVRQYVHQCIRTMGHGGESVLDLCGGAGGNVTPVLTLCRSRLVVVDTSNPWLATYAERLGGCDVHIPTATTDTLPSTPHHQLVASKRVRVSAANRSTATTDNTFVDVSLYRADVVMEHHTTIWSQILQSRTFSTIVCAFAIHQVARSRALLDRFVHSICGVLGHRCLIFVHDHARLFNLDDAPDQNWVPFYPPPLVVGLYGHQSSYRNHVRM